MMRSFIMKQFSIE